MPFLMEIPVVGNESVSNLTDNQSGVVSLNSLKMSHYLTHTLNTSFQSIWMGFLGNSLHKHAVVSQSEPGKDLHVAVAGCSPFLWVQHIPWMIATLSPAEPRTAQNHSPQHLLNWSELATELKLLCTHFCQWRSLCMVLLSYSSHLTM